MSKNKILYYLSQISEEKIKNKSNGVSKKISAQINFFNSIPDIKCEYVCLTLAATRIQKLFNLFSKKLYDAYLEKLSEADFIYIRAIVPNTQGMISLLKNIKKKNPSCKIIYEIPTFPYDKEFDTIKKKFFLVLDRINRQKLKEAVDRIVTLTEDKNIFNIPCINFKNGVDFNSIPVCKKKAYDKNCINLIAVAQFTFGHGYERIIEGLNNYKKSNVFLHLVGNGEELKKYKKLVEKYELGNQVFFYGPLYGEELTKIFDISDAGLCSFCGHKQQIFVTSELKSREYLCRALPVVTSTKIDILPDDFKYCLRVPEDDSPIDIQKVVDFVTDLYSNSDRTAVTKEIRTFAEKFCSMDYSMRSVAEYILNE